MDCCLCGTAECALIFQSAAPLWFTLPLHSVPDAAAFAPLEIALCHRCGHVFNRSLDERLLNRLYAAAPLPCMPVHPSMTARHQWLLDQLEDSGLSGRTVLEIGGGSGHFARLLAAKATWVDVFEPNRHLTKALMPETNIAIHQALFQTAAQAPRRYTLAVCRQVAEHVPDLPAFLSALAQSLEENGLAYIEVPSLDYILEQRAWYDLHFQHVHYLTPAVLTALAARAGLVQERLLPLMDGHDFGLLLRKVAQPVPAPLPANRFKPHHVAQTLQEARHAAARRLSLLSGPALLYGATPQAQMFLNGLDGRHPFSAVLDDNPAAAQRMLYDHTGTLPVHPAADYDLSGVRGIIIGAYLHAAVISDRLRQRGFTGEILSITELRAGLGNSDRKISGFFA